MSPRPRLVLVDTSRLQPDPVARLSVVVVMSPQGRLEGAHGDAFRARLGVEGTDPGFVDGDFFCFDVFGMLVVCRSHRAGGRMGQ